MNTIPKRIEALRASMKKRGVTHYLVPSADEHGNEYLPEWRLRRSWMSGFTGSAGDLLVGTVSEETWLFTDGRYHLQAEQELERSGIGLQKVGAKGVKTLREMLRALAGRHGATCVVGYDPMVLPIATVDELARVLEEGDASLLAISPNLVDELWNDRPTPPKTPLLACPTEWTGRTVGDKVEQLRRDLGERNADTIVVGKLDQIAWLTNLRATDEISYNPVFESYLYVSRDAVHLFLHAPPTRLPTGFGNDISGLRAHEYEDFIPFLQAIEPSNVFIDPDGTTQGVLDVLEGNSNVRVVRGPSPIEKAKAIKNDVEQQCMARANLMASVAKTRAILWLTCEIEAGRQVTERSFLEKIEGLYAEIEGYRQLSFATISATGDHGAFVHYSSADETVLQPGELFLVDSGIQFDGGTTDDTRTVTVGTPTPDQRRVYTNVFKAHVAAASQVFPEDATGSALDAVARARLWDVNLPYGHGTGHGVGAFLNVHEGPFALTEAKGGSHATRGLKAGMITSIEPGYYREGFGGIRLESLCLITDTGKESDGRKWLCFMPLTWIPFDPALIDVDLLDTRERDWVRWYHDQCLEVLAPHLSADENAQLHALLK